MLLDAWVMFMGKKKPKKKVMEFDGGYYEYLE
jgi:hypothetical protein